MDGSQSKLDLLSRTFDSVCKAKTNQVLHRLIY